MSPAAPAYADLQYSTVGDDVYRVEPAASVSRVTYTGTQHLSMTREGRSLRFEARAQYTHDGPDGRGSDEAHFVQMLQPNGTFEDRDDDDPDFLTILNQPFAVRLDATTLRDVQALRKPVPFAASSPLGGSSELRGFLRPGVNGPVDGRPTVAVRFEAEGSMNGPLPGHSGATVAGGMHMDGTAYYALRDAILLALNVTLTIEARLRERETSASVPIRITYHRWIRATPAGATAGPVR